MTHKTRLLLGLNACFLAGLVGCSSLAGAPPKGAAEAADADELARIKAVGAKAPGIIVWSSSRDGNHDLFTMRTDGSDVKAITHGDQVDWFPRFSADGQQILFTRSKKGWVSESDANSPNKWDLYTVHPDGSEATKVAENASWGSWAGPNEILFVRGTKILKKTLGSDDETEIMDSTGVEALDGALLQQPTLSPDGKYLAITLRGAKRETGIWNIAEKTWLATGLGCQVSWTPDGEDIYWVNPTGNGGSEVYRRPLTDGHPEKDLSDDELQFMDLPGRRSHEYFPKLSTDGKWLVWGITQRGHDHDIADYEVYLWEVGSAPDSAARLTFHSSNDRWPDVYLDQSGGASSSDTTATEDTEEAGTTEETEE